MKQPVSYRAARDIYFRLTPFSDFRISQGSVATRLRRGGIFKHDSVANLLPSQSVKMFENRLIFGEVMGKSLVFCFFRCLCKSK